MTMENKFEIKEILVEHLQEPIGIDCYNPVFSWVLTSNQEHVFQTKYQLQIFKQNELIIDSGIIEDDNSIENVIDGFKITPMTRYTMKLNVWDNYQNKASNETFFETGRLDIPFTTKWVEPVQEPTPSSLEGKEMTRESVASNPNEGKERSFDEFRPSKYIRVPFEVDRSVQKARVYISVHGIYQLYINGSRIDNRELAPEHTSYHKLLQYQTYDLTNFIKNGQNVIGVIIGDGWWRGRVGTTGDSCQYGNKLGLLLEGIITYFDGTTQVFSGEQGVSSSGPIIYSDLFVGEKYDARKELNDWSTVSYDDSSWQKVIPVDYPMNNLIGQSSEPVKIVETFKPKKIIHSPAGETIIDVGRIIAGFVEFSLVAPAGIEIKLEHSEVLDTQGNYYNNILGINKEQMDVYITKEEYQTYRPHFTYHGFRYIRISNWPGEISINNFKVHVLSSNLKKIGSFTTNDKRINQLQENIVSSQIANSISIPTDCPQREKAGWTGDIMAYASTMCFNTNAHSFLKSWLHNVRKDQLENGAVPVVVPYLKAYEIFIKGMTGFETSCGWGDAIITVPYAMYQVYGDKNVLVENYDAMKKWLDYIQNRMHNFHPEDYENWDDKRKKRSYYLWNTDFHFGDWLIPSIVLGNPDGGAMMDTAYATMNIVGPAYAAYSSRFMAKIAHILDKETDAKKYHDLYEKIREAFIEEYVHDDGTIDADFQGIYVIALKNNLVTEEIKPKMINHLRTLIENNGNCLDTGFLSVLFLMDVLCENDCRDLAYKLLFQTKCPSWLYMVEHGATTMWESWGAIGEDGSVSTYSYNHYAFGCIGEWLYKEIGGLQVIEPGYHKFKVCPALDCGLTKVNLTQYSPYGLIEVNWQLVANKVILNVKVPVNTTAKIVLPHIQKTVDSGDYTFVDEISS